MMGTLQVGTPLCDALDISRVDSREGGGGWWDLGAPQVPLQGRTVRESRAQDTGGGLHPSEQPGLAPSSACLVSPLWLLLRVHFPGEIQGRKIWWWVCRSRAQLHRLLHPAAEVLCSS